MTHGRAFELPRDKADAYRRAVRLESITIVYFASAVTVVYLALGSSQAMKAAWIEDILGFVPPITFLIAARVRYKEPNDRFPYGYHRVVGIGFLCASIALLALGAFVLYDSATKLLTFEHPPIGLVQPFGEPVWLGWFMLAALLWTGVPAVILGRMKLPLAHPLHDKILYADAEMNRADWLTAGAAMLGVIGIRFGLWWADSVAAIVISLDILKDGFENTASAVRDLMDERPTRVDESAVDPTTTRIENELRRLDWVRDVSVRLRDEGHVFYGDAVVVPRRDDDLVRRIDDAKRRVMELDWRIHDIAITPLPRLEQPQDEREHGAVDKADV